MRRLALVVLAVLLIPTTALAQYAAVTFSMGSPTTVPSSTVAGLPACGAATTGWVFIVTNALTPTLGLAVVGGGAVSVVVKCNGTSWLVGQ